VLVGGQYRGAAERRVRRVALRYAPGIGLAWIGVQEPRGTIVDPRRVRLQLRLVRVAIRAASPGERAAMVPRAIEILDKVALEVQAEPDPALMQLLVEVRDEVQTIVD
jgi:hypothetical protein